MSGRLPITARFNWLRGWRLVLVGAVLLLVLAAIATRPLIQQWGDRVPYNSGDPLTVTWQLMWLSHALLHEPWNLTQTNIYWPLPDVLFFHHLLLPAVLPFGLVYALTGNPLIALNAMILLTIVLNGLAGGLLGYRWTGSRSAAAVAAAVLGFSPLLLQRLFHPPLIMIWWTPLALICVDRFVWKPRLRDALGAVLFAWLQYVTALYLNIYVALSCLIVLAVGAWYRWRVSGAGKPGTLSSFVNRRAVLSVAIAAIVGVVLFLPPTLGYLRAADAWGVKRPIDEVIDYSPEPRFLLSADPGSLLYSSVLPGPTAEETKYPHEKYLFPGLLPLGLAVLAVLCRGRDPVHRARVWAMAAIAVLGIVLSLGPYLVVDGRSTGISLPFLVLYELVPGFQSMRVPTRFVLMAVPALAALAAFAVLAVRERWPRARWVGPVVAVLLVVEAARLPVQMSTLYDVHDPRELERLSQVAAPLLWLPLDGAGPQIGYLESARMVQNRALLPMVNGFLAFVPPVHQEIVRLEATTDPEEMVEVLSLFGVRTVVVDTVRMDSERARRWLAFAESQGLLLPGTGRLRFVQIPVAAANLGPLRLEIAGGRALAGLPMQLGIGARNESTVPWVDTQPRGRLQANVRWLDGTGRDVASTRSPVVLPLYVAPQQVRAIDIEITPPDVPGEYWLEVEVSSAGLVASRPVAVEGDRLPLSTDPEAIDPKTGPGDLVDGLLHVHAPPDGAITASAASAMQIAGWIENTGGAVWRKRVPHPSTGMVQIGYRWYPRGKVTPDAALTDLEGRIGLDRDLLPGDRTEFSGRVRVPSTPGEYTLEVGIVIENVGWLYAFPRPETAPSVVRHLFVTVPEVQSQDAQAVLAGS